MRLKNKTILITSNEPWGDIWYSKQHYANELSKLGNTVYFIDPVKKWCFKNIFTSKVEINEICDKLYTISYNNSLPVTIYPSLFTLINDIINERRITKLIKTKDVIWWKFDPFRFLKTQKTKTIYHVVDPYMHLWQDKILAQNANLVICTSPKYVDFYIKQKLKTLFIPHGISNDELIIDKQKVKSLEDKYGNFSIIVGTLNNDNDFILLRAIADEGITVIVIGKDNEENMEWQELKKHPNVNFLGVVNSRELKNYIAASKVCLNVYKFSRKRAIGNRSPLKILNYISQMKPVVTSIDSDIRELEDIIIYRALNVEDYIALVKKGLKNELFVDPVAVKEYINKQQYSKLVSKIGNALD